QGLDANAEKRWQAARLHPAHDLFSGARGGGVFFRVRTGAEAVFEVDPEVFDCFAGQFLVYPIVNAGSEPPKWLTSPQRFRVFAVFALEHGCVDAAERGSRHEADS